MSLKISSISTKFHVVLIFIIFLSRVSDASNDVDENNPCYNSEGVAINCQPEFVNAAFGKSVQATSTCGSPAHEFCAQQRQKQQQNGVSSCFVCDTSNPVLSHPPSHLTDPHNSNNLTCWQQQKLRYNLQETNLTISLGKKFEVTYVSLQFCHTRPDSLAIYKSSDFGQTWIPFQFFSSQCEHVYGRKPRNQTNKWNKQEAFCSEDFSQTTNFVGTSRVAFNTLEGRSSNNELDANPILQDWQTATDIRIVFNRLNTRDISPTAQLNSYSFYSMSDVAIGGRCKCNGHASRCAPVAKSRYSKEVKLVCQCQHNTDGDDCERCKPFYMDRPWSRGGRTNTTECVACNCNNHSNKCHFDPEIFALTNNQTGGVCEDCLHNTVGRNCHQCRKGYYRDLSKLLTHKHACKKCHCHQSGSVESSCHPETGQCPCKPGVTGLTCNRCAPGYQQSESILKPCVC
ncbi:hypothetical protein HELRODRAFT_73849 [Helobdella robusta]|uniref:Laminin N-terminal domain-containing protein n=1 Tax=Helobdella robusta TaxID=6412 RepID=T1G1J4_HELRO|nr:hypothetical protein HELRODRAFT_73849 [Helobdella robusta]ESO09475.1 hypothetical protein HELRODRAFT_73849 [Helobdella robusta]